MAGAGSVWAQSEEVAVLGPQVFRIGKSIFFTVHERFNGTTEQHLVSAHLASCDGKLVSNPFALQIVQGETTSLRQQQAAMLEKLQKPVDSAITLSSWEDAAKSVLTQARAATLSRCKNAQAMPGNILLPVEGSQDTTFSAVGARGTRKGNLVELWTELASFKSEPFIFDGKPLVSGGVEIKNSVYTGERSVRREIYNCIERTMDVAALVRYKEGGSVLDSLDHGSMKRDFTPLVPNSLGEAMLDFVCKVY